MALVLIILASIVTIEWLLRNVFALKMWSGAFHLTLDREPESDAPLPRLSIVVAAKDEEKNIEACVRSLLMQDYPDFDITVIDDRSEDRTADIVRKLMAEDDRVKLVQIETLPDGWCGKNHAMQRGIETTDAPWIFMTDADCWQTSPASVRTAMRYALDRKADMLTLLPLLAMECFWERFLLPICAGVLMIWFRPDRVNDTAKPHAYANGMFMMIRREAYDRIGQHEAIGGSLMEDMDLARRVKHGGMRLVMTPSRGLFNVHMYDTARALYWGWIRIFVGAFRNLWKIACALLLLIVRGLTLPVTTAVGWSLYAAGDAAYLPLAILSTAGLATQLVMTARYYHHTQSDWRLGVIYPIPALIVATILLRAMVMLRPGATIVWRGTRYRLSHS